MAEGVSRRDFLKVGVVGGVSALAGVGLGTLVGTTLKQPEVDRWRDEVASLREQLGLPPLVDQVNVYNWSEYIADGLLQIFREEFGVAVNYITFESTDEVWATLAAGQTPFDVVMLTDYLIPDAIDADLIQPLPKAAIPNMKFIADKYKDPPYDPNNDYSAPYVWGTTGIGWNEDRVTGGVTGWSEMFDANSGGFLETHNKKVTMIPDMRETIGAALKFLGYSMSDTDSSHLNEAETLLKQQKPYLATYADATAYIPNLATGQYNASHAWNGDVFVAADESDFSIKYTIPKEGGTLWVDNMVIPTNAPNPRTGAAWIDYVLRPEVVAHITDWRFYANPSTLADTLVSQEVLDDPQIYPPQDVLAKLEILRPLTQEELEALDAVWTRVQAA